MSVHSENRLKVIASLAVVRDGKDAASMADYMSERDGEICCAMIEASSNEKSPKMKAEQIVCQLLASERFSSLAEVHPAWILEKLNGESPRVAGIILRSLPSKHVRFILKNMSPMQRAKLPNMVESFAVAKPVLDLIRRRFESNFLPMRTSRAIDRFTFEHLYYLKGEEFEVLVRELGLAELAIALSGMRGKGLHAVYNRLDLKDAKRLQRAIRDVKSISPELSRQARYTVLEVEGNHVGPDRMLTNIGLAAMSSAIGEDHDELVGLIMQRLAPSDGYLLKRFIDERRMRNLGAVQVERQELILATVKSLSEEGLIDPALNRLFDSRETPISLEGPIPGPEADEETATVQQLA